MFTHNGSVHNIFQFKPNEYIFTILINCIVYAMYNNTWGKRKILKYKTVS